jgi:hypothetical protein
MILAGVVLLACLPAETGCHIVLHEAERAMPVCDGMVYDNMNERAYKIVRWEEGLSSEKAMTLRISKECDVTWPEDLSGIGVLSMDIRNPRSNRRSRLIIRTKLPDGESEVACEGRIREYDPMKLVCDWDEGDLWFDLIPLEGL